MRTLPIVRTRPFISLAVTAGAWIAYATADASGERIEIRLVLRDSAEFLASPILLESLVLLPARGVAVPPRLQGLGADIEAVIGLGNELDPEHVARNGRGRRVGVVL